MKKVILLLADGFEEVEAMTPIDFLRRADIDVTIAGVTGKTVTSAHNVPVTADVKLGNAAGSLSDFDGVVIPGGMPGASNIAASKEAAELINGMVKESKLVAAICASPAVVLSPLGVVNGKNVTCYPGFEDDLQGANFSRERVVIDGNFITSRGPGTAAEFAIAVIRYLVGDEKADEIHNGTLQK